MEEKRNSSEDERLDPDKSPIPRADFMREKIKQRPINKKKLLRRTLITVTMAVVFGAVACLTFVFLSPVINNKLYPEESPAPIALTEETVQEEMQPEDMYADDNAIAAEAASAAIDMASSEISRMQQEMNSYHFDSSNYIEMYASLKTVATNTAKSIVTVTSRSSDTNWINSPYESEGQTSGVIVADNGAEYMILTQTSAIDDAESIQVTFFDGSTTAANLKMSDKVTGLSILAVKNRNVDDSTREKIKAAPLGSSSAGVVTGTPVIAIGSPTGIQGSICYGFVTSDNSALDLPDSKYMLLTTDISGSNNASGAIINLAGSVVGFIDMHYNNANMPGTLRAVGITELRALIEDLSNEKSRAFLGVHGQTVPQELRDSEEIPEGVYVTMTDIDSPAMLAGVQSGDIITAINDEKIDKIETFISKLRGIKPGEDVHVSLMRQAAEGYVDLTIDIAAGSATE